MRALTFVLALGVLAAVGVSSTPADGGTSRSAAATPAPCAVRQGTPRPTAASLSFVRDPSILLVSADGKRLFTALRGDPGEDPFLAYYGPAWSADGRCLAAREEYHEQSMSTADASLVVQRGKRQVFSLSICDCTEGRPSWAPDGRRLVIPDYLDEGYSALVIEGVGSSTKVGLTSGRFFDEMPAWSPDGTRIAFARLQAGTMTLRVIRPGHRGVKRLTRAAAGNPSWSPDGRRLVFESNRGIAVINADGSELRYLTRSKRDGEPAWSPDGRTIAFVRSNDIWLMRPDGSKQRLFVKNGSQPAWKPAP